MVQELRMRQGNKKIFHLEAWVIKVMSIYKVRALSFSHGHTLICVAAFHVRF